VSRHRHATVVLLALTLGLAALAPSALAAPAPAGVQAGRVVQAAARVAGAHHAGASCNVGVPVIGGLLGGACEAAGEALGAVGGLAGEAAGAIGSGILDQVATWMIGAATSITGFVSREMAQTTTPQLGSAWYAAQFRPMADLGAALGLLVALIALASAAIRRSPQALAGTIAGIARAGIGTGLLVALTMIGLGVADQISSAVLTSSPHEFWATAEHAWGTSGFGGFGSSALAMLIALIEVFAAVFVWLELIVRNAAIYLAVLFFPVALAAAIWPALGAWPGRLGRLLMLFVILKPVALIVLSFAGNAAAAGLSFSGGVSGSVGTILAATVIFALAAFAPWALMYLLAADAESAYMSASLRAAAGTAVGDQNGPSARTAGGLRDPGGNGSGGASGGGSADGSGGPGGSGGGGSPLTGGPSTSGAGAGSDAGAGDSGEGGTLPVGAESIGAGSVGAAAGINAQPASASAPSSHATGGGSQSESAPARHQAAGTDGESAFPRALAAVPDAPPGDQRPGRQAAAGGAPTGASPQRPGSAGTPTPSQDEPATQPASEATQPLAGSPRSRARAPSLTLAGAPLPMRPRGDASHREEGSGGGE
jgi:hypothetical protein